MNPFSLTQKDPEALRALQQARGGPQSQEELDAQAERQRAKEEERQAFLTMILAPAARERLARIALVKPDKARMLEDQLIMMARTGRTGGQVSEEALINMLEAISNKEGAGGKSGPKITFARRAGDDW